MTKLEAVNQVMRAIGMYAVSALDTNGASAQAEVEREIDTQSGKIQSERRWRFNQVLGYTLTPDGLGLILPPSDAIEIYSADGRTALVTQSGYLFNLTKNTNVFDDAIVVDYTVLCPWNNIPVTVQHYIVAAAAEATNDQRGKPDRARDLREKLHKAASVAKDANSYSASINMLKTTEIQAFTGNRRTYITGL